MTAFFPKVSPILLRNLSSLRCVAVKIKNPNYVLTKPISQNSQIFESSHQDSDASSFGSLSEAFLRKGETSPESDSETQQILKTPTKIKIKIVNL